MQFLPVHASAPIERPALISSPFNPRYPHPIITSHAKGGLNSLPDTPVESPVLISKIRVLPPKWPYPVAPDLVPASLLLGN